MSQYSYQNSHSNGDQWNTNVTDEWLDRLALDGYDIKQILASIFIRYKEDSVAFGKYMSRRAASLKSCKYKVKNFLPKLPINMQVNQIVSLLMDKYRISSDGAQLLLEDYLWLYQGQNQVLLQLSRRGMTVVKCQQGRSNSVIFFCNDQMRSNYQKFGDVVCVDFKPINIKNNPKNKNYMAGIFTGQDTNLHHILFGVALINQDKYQNYSNVIKSFFKAMKLRRYPQSFIVGNCQTLYRAICDISLTNQQQGRQSFGCLVGWHHLLQKLMKQYKSHKDKDQILQKFGNVLSSLNKQQMVSKIKQLLKLLPNDQHLLKFIAEHSKYFVANNQPCFIGFGIEKDHFSFLYKAMESFFKNVESIGFFFQQAVKLQEMLLSRIKKTGYELITLKQFDTLGVKLTDQIKYLSIRLQKKLFKKFLMMYQTAVKHAKIIARSLDGLYYQVTFNTDRQLPYKAYVYTLYYNIEDACWRCNCGFIQQSGIPCAHLIKLIRKFRGSLAYYINRRWMIQNSKFNPQQAYNNEQKGMQAQRDSSQYEQISVQNIKMEVIKKQQQVKQVKPIKKQAQILNNRNGVHLYNKTIENNGDEKINKDIDRNGDKDRNKTRNRDEQLQNDEEQENQDDQIQQLDRYCYYDVENIPDNDQQQQQHTQKKEQPQLKYNYKHDEDIENMYNLNIEQQQQQQQQQHQDVHNQQPIVQQPLNQQQIIQEYQEQDFLEEQQGQQQKYQQLILHYNSDPFIQQQHKQLSVIKQQQLLQLIANQKKDKSPQYENENKLQLNISQVQINENQYGQNNNQIQHPHPHPQQQAHPDRQIQIYNQEHVNQRQIQKPQLNLCMIEEKLIDDQPNLQKQVENISVKESQVLQSLQNANEDEKQSADDKQIEQQAHQIEILPNMKQDQVKHNQIIEVQKQVQREFEQLQVSQQQQRKLQEYEQKQQKQEKQINQQQLKQYQNKQKEIEKENINQMQQQQQQILESIQVGQQPKIEPSKQKQIQVQMQIQVENKEIQKQQYHHEHYQQQKSHDQQDQQKHQQQHQQQQKQQEQPQVYQYQQHQILEQQQQQEKVKKQLSIIREQQESQKKQNSEQMEVQQIEQIKVNQQKILSNFIIQSQYIDNEMEKQCKNNVEISKQRIIEEINNKQQRMKFQNIIKQEFKNYEIVIEKRPKASGVKIKFQHISIPKQQSQQSQYEQEQQYQEEEKERDQQ